MSPEIVSFTKSGGPLAKRISLDANGQLISDGSACVMERGTAHRKTVANVEQLGTLINVLTRNEALALGMLRRGLPNAVGVATKRLLNGGARQPDVLECYFGSPCQSRIGAPRASAATLAAIPAGASPADIGVQSMS
jgi:hypothetical protein